MKEQDSSRPLTQSFCGLASRIITAFPVTVYWDGTQYEINMPTGIPVFGFVG